MTASSEAARPALEVTGLVKDYRRQRAVEHVSLTVPAGAIVGLLGPNGAGKTTLLRAVAGVLQPTAGQILIAGHDLAREELAAKRRLGFVPETPSPYELLSVEEHLEFTARLWQLDDWRTSAAELLARLGLTEKRRELALALSKGMKQKLLLACALLHRPDLLLLDEPLLGIDPRGQREVKELLTEAAAAGQGVLISTHLLAIAEELCDQVVILHRGRRVAAGSAAELRALAADQSLEELFLRLTAEEADAAVGLA